MRPGLALRLAARNLRRRPAQALLLLLTLTIATGVLGVAMSLYGSADASWNRTWRATRGFHVGFTVYHPPDEPGDRALVAALRRRAGQLTRAPGVVAAGGPWTHLYGSIQVAGGTEDLTAEVRDPTPSQVDQPLVTSGRWLGEGGGVVLEGGLAATLRAGAGDTVTIQGRPVPVRGVAQTVSRGRFPLSRPAQVWATPETARQLRDLGMTQEGFELQLRLADPTRAADFVAAHQSLLAVPSSSSVVPYLGTWQQRRSESHSDIDILAGTLFAAGALIAILTVATASVLVAGRMAAQIRQVGTLKAVGVTPRQVMVVLLVEHLVIAAGATAAGLGIGRLLAPPVAATSVTLLGRPEPPPLTATRVGIVTAVTVAVVLLGTVRPALRARSGRSPPARGHPGARAGWRVSPPAPASPCPASLGSGRRGGGRAGCSPTRPGWPSAWRCSSSPWPCATASTCWTSGPPSRVMPPATPPSRSSTTRSG
jgi:putative ABC transport system permease protein